MSISRRLFLATTPVVYTSVLYSSPVFSCEPVDSIPWHFAPMPPYDFLAEGSDSDSGIEKFLDKKYGHDAWSYSLSPISLQAPEGAENPNMIPVEIRTDNYTLAGRYRSVALFVLRLVWVSEAEKFGITRRVPEVFMFSKAAEYEFGEHTIPSISMRLQYGDTGVLRMIAVFTPVDTSKKKVVVKQDKTTKLYRCIFDQPVYVEGM